MAGGAVEAEAACGHAGKIFLGKAESGGKAGKHNVKNSCFGKHNTAGQSGDGCAVVEVGEHEHGSGKYRNAVAHNICPALFYGAGSIVIGVDAHAAGTEDKAAGFFRVKRRLCVRYGRDNVFDTVSYNEAAQDGNAEGF